MRIYKDLLTDEEMFTDIYSIKETDNGFFLEVEGKIITRSGDTISDSLIGGNASAEEVADDFQSDTVSGVDIILNSNLQETSFDKQSFKIYVKDYLKALQTKLKETDSDRVALLTSQGRDCIKRILQDFKKYRFYTGAKMNPEGMVGMLDFREDEVTPFMIFFNYGLVIEKV